MTPHEIVTQLVGLTVASPYPVYAVDRYRDMLAWNPATTEYYTDFALLPECDQNMI